jgi:hypothetical protein
MGCDMAAHGSCCEKELRPPVRQEVEVAAADKQNSGEQNLGEYIYIKIDFACFFSS